MATIHFYHFLPIPTFKTCKALKRLTMLARVVGLIPGGARPCRDVVEMEASYTLGVN